MGARIRRSNADANPKAPRTKRNEATSTLPDYQDVRELKTKAETFKPANKSQERYLNQIENNTVTFGVGPAGTGKSYCAAYMAATMLKNKQVDKIIIVHPAVEAGKSLGFLPGEMMDKIGPFVAPFMQALSKMLGKGHVEALLLNNRIEVLPLAFARGHTFEKSFVVFEEAQNATKKEMQLFLTRIGNDCKIVIDGDLDQRDNSEVGLSDAVWRFKHCPSVGIHRFTVEDIVRSGLAKEVVLRYSDSYAHESESREGLDTFLLKS